MSTYLVHLPRGATRRPDLAADIRFVRDGFSLVAFLVSPIWLLTNRVWLGLVGWALASALLTAAVVWGAIGGANAVVVYGLLAFFVGLEAGQLKSRAASRRKQMLVDVVAGSSAPEAARYFFAIAAAGSGRAAAGPGVPAVSEEERP